MYLTYLKNAVIAGRRPDGKKQNFLLFSKKSKLLARSNFFDIVPSAFTLGLLNGTA
jgi:hypothetical protein